jgi:enterochelin esterase family protein
VNRRRISGLALAAALAAVERVDAGRASSAGGAPQSAPESARIARVAAEVAAGNSGAVEAFWSELRAQGTPLFEACDDPERTLVTFVWRGTPETRNVLLYCDVETDIARLQLVRLADTDVWYRSYRLPSAARFYYQLAPDDSLVPFADEKDWPTRQKGFVADPLNPHGVLIGADQRYSFALLPGAPRHAAYAERADVTKGKFEPERGAFQLTSAALGAQRVWLYTTPGLADSGGAANAVLFLDGSGAWQLIPSVRMLDNLFHDGKLGPTVAVYADSPDRERDLACSDAYLAFLVDELLPWVQERLGVDFEGFRTVISGRSLGGLFAAYACLRRPDVFGGAMMQSPSLWWGAERDGANEWLTRELEREERRPVAFFVAPGIFETGANSRTSVSILESSRRFRDVAQAKGYAVTYREITGGHDPLNWEVSLPEGIEVLLPPAK